MQEQLDEKSQKQIEYWKQKSQELSEKSADYPRQINELQKTNQRFSKEKQRLRRQNKKLQRKIDKLQEEIGNLTSQLHTKKQDWEDEPIESLINWQKEKEANTIGTQTEDQFEKPNEIKESEAKESVIQSTNK